LPEPGSLGLLAIALAGRRISLPRPFPSSPKTCFNPSSGGSRMSRTRVVVAVTGVALAVGLTAAHKPAQATLALTAAGIADGFTLSTFVSGYSFGAPFSVNYGPLAEGILPNGNVITGSFGDAKIYVFKDVDGQMLSTAVSATPYTFGPGNGFYAMTTAGGQAYGAQQRGGVYELFNTSGTHAAIPGLTATSFLGMWGDPVNGHIIASANQGLIDINPTAGTFRVIAPNPGADGVTVSPDGKTLYIANVNNGTIQAYDIASGNFLTSYSRQGHGPGRIGCDL
jgi:hypothetical protein